MSGNGSAKPNTFSIDDREVDILAGEPIFRAARRLGIKLPHLCYSPKPGYRPDGNCRVCMVEIEGERVLAASCIRTPTPGMKVKTQTDRAKTARRMVVELLLTDQPPKDVAHDPQSEFWKTADRHHVAASRFPRRAHTPPDRSHPAMAVNLDACIQCNLCVRACREVQVNDVIGMAGRGYSEKIVFDFDDPMGASTCVACGECVQACPTGALMPATLVDDANIRTEFPDREVHSVCPYCGVGCQLTYHAKGTNEEAYLFQKLVRAGFGTNNVDHCTRLCHASSVAALLETIGSAAVTATFNECKNSDVIIVIGANPTENHPVAATFFKQAAKRGAELIVMDPRGQALKRHAAHMLQ